MLGPEKGIKSLYVTVPKPLRKEGYSKLAAGKALCPSHPVHIGHFLTLGHSWYSKEDS
jgi:hypothetical protein